MPNQCPNDQMTEHLGIRAFEPWVIDSAFGIRVSDFFSVKFLLTNPTPLRLTF
jgi:hypothetical protein